MAIPGDGRIEEKKLEKISKYQDLKKEIERLWEKQEATEDSPTGNSTYPMSVPLKFLDLRRGSERKRTPK